MTASPATFLPDADPYVHIGDLDKRTVSAELWSADRTTMLVFSFVVSHLGDAVHHVAFQPGWRVMARVIGLDPDDSDDQRRLVAAAKRAFVRRVGGRG